jgi:hypothetical protein
MSDLSASDDGYRQNDDEAKDTFVFIHTTHDFFISFLFSDII